MRIGRMSATCGLLAVASTTGLALATGPLPADASTNLQSRFLNDTLVVQWGVDATEIARQAVLAAVAGQVVATAPDGAQILSTSAGIALAGTVLEQFPQTIVADVISTDIFLGDQFNLNSIDLQNLSFTHTSTNRVLLPVVLEGGLYTIELAPFSSRAPGFKVLIDDGSGQLIEIEPPAPKTWRGRVVEMPNSVVAASIDNGQMSASIILHDNTDVGWFIQPLAEVLNGADNNIHIVYSADDIRPHAHECGGALVHDQMQFNAAGIRNDSLRGGGFLVTEMAYDADFQYYQLNGSSTNNTIADIENLQNACNIVYERDCDITWVTTQILVRTSSGTNPYTSNDSETLLNQFRSQWLNNHGNIPRDLAHLMTGRNMGGVLGIAWLNGVCNNFGFGVSRARFTSNFGQRTALVCHEVGHNFSAPHCSGSSCKIMCAGLGGCGGIGLPNFSTGSANTIINYAAGRFCLDDGSPPPNDAPVVDIILPFTTTYNVGDLITFAASANDTEDGNIAEDIVWTSNINGAIGSGATISTSALAVGNHVVTASVTDSGNAVGSDTINITINPGATTPARPDRPTATDQGNGSALVTWTDLPNETSWDVQRQQQIGSTWTNTTIVASGLAQNTTSFTNNPGAFGKFRYRIRASNSAGTSQWSLWATVTIIDPNITIPDRPAQPTASNLGGGSVLVQWTDLPNETYWRIQRQQNIGGTWTNTTTLNNNLPANTTSYNDAPGSGQFRYRVRAGNSAGLSQWSAWRTITVN